MTKTCGLFCLAGGDMGAQSGRSGRRRLLLIAWVSPSGRHRSRGRGSAPRHLRQQHFRPLNVDQVNTIRQTVKTTSVHTEHTESLSKLCRHAVPTIQASQSALRASSQSGCALHHGCHHHTLDFVSILRYETSWVPGSLLHPCTVAAVWRTTCSVLVLQSGAICLLHAATCPIDMQHTDMADFEMTTTADLYRIHIRNAPSIIQKERPVLSLSDFTPVLS